MAKLFTLGCVRPLLNALEEVATGYYDLAEEACERRDPHSVYRAMKKHIETQNEMRTLIRRYEDMSHG